MVRVVGQRDQNMPEGRLRCAQAQGELQKAPRAFLLVELRHVLHWLFPLVSCLGFGTRDKRAACVTRASRTHLKRFGGFRDSAPGKEGPSLCSRELLKREDQGGS